MAIAPQFQSGQGYGQNSPQLANIFNLPSPNRGGGFFGGLNDFLFGTPESFTQYNRFTPQGMQTLESLLSSGMQNMQNPYAGFEPLEQETMNKYYQQIIPQLAQQFAGSNARSSSPSFAANLSQSASGLSALLNAQKARYGQENRQFGLQQAQLGLQDPFQIRRNAPTTGAFGNALSGFSENAGTIAKLLPLLL